MSAPPRFVAYLRVSTGRQGRSGLGLEAQRAAVAAQLGSNGLLTVNPTRQASLAYDAEKDFAPVGLARRTPLAVAVHRGQPPRSLAELLSHAKANPGRVTVGSAGIGSISHLAIQVFKGETGAGLQHIPYGGGGALVPDLVAGTVNGACTEVSTALPLQREGAIRILGVTAARRLAVAPELPTVEEGGVPVFHAAAFLGIVVPAGTPVEATRALQTALAVALADPGARQRLEQMGSEIAKEEMTPHGFEAVVAHEMAWTRATAARAGLRC